MKHPTLSSLFTLALGALLLFQGFSRERSAGMGGAMELPRQSAATVEPLRAAKIYFRLLSWVSQVLPAKGAAASCPPLARASRPTTPSAQPAPLCALSHAPAFPLAPTQP